MNLADERLILLSLKLLSQPLKLKDLKENNWLFREEEQNNVLSASQVLFCICLRICFFVQINLIMLPKELDHKKNYSLYTLLKINFQMAILFCSGRGEGGDLGLCEP